VIVAETTTTPHQERSRFDEKIVWMREQGKVKEVGRRVWATVPGTAHIESTVALIHALIPLGLQAVAAVMAEEVATLATDTPMPIVWSDRPTSQLNSSRRCGMVRILVFSLTPFPAIRTFPDFPQSPRTP
jgi:hypothetical protein